MSGGIGVRTSEKAAEWSWRLAGSFRDPSGYVFERGGRLFRALSEESYEGLRELNRIGFLGPWMEEGRVVRTAFVEGRLGEQLSAEQTGFSHFVEHEFLRHLTFPYEWSYSMLGEAGLLTLGLQKELVKAGYTLKDATAYNVQFRHSRPVFIDLGSMERARRADVWYALGQFQRMFLYPLLLCGLSGWDLRSYFLASLDGRSLDQVWRSLGWRQAWRPSLFLDVTLPFWLERGASGGGGGRSDYFKSKSSDPSAQLMNLGRLERKLRGLMAKHRPRGIWTNYTETCSYDAEAEAGKKNLVRAFLEEAKPGSVLDLGCNTGEYSEIAAALGAEVVAADADCGVVEVFYRRLRRDPKRILPVVLDLANPSPGIGYCNRERASFLDRFEADCVLALALMHHLLVSANMSVAAIGDLLERCTRRLCVLEFVPREDSMFERLLQYRVDVFGGLTLGGCREVLMERFEIMREEPIPGCGRTLLFLKKR